MKFIFNIRLIPLFVSLITAPLRSQESDAMLPHIRDDRLWLSGQSNIVSQAQLDRGEGRNEKATSQVFTLYSGIRLSPSMEVLLDLEHSGGNGLKHGMGLSAPTNADFIGDDAFEGRPYVSRFFLHKVFALSNEQAEVGRTFLSTFPLLPSRRIEVRAGKFGLPDFFDVNSAGGDTHLGFLNSSLMQNSAYDYASDASGYSWGTMAEYVDPKLSVRFAEMLMPSSIGGEHLVWNLRQAHSENLELEFSVSLTAKHPAVVRVLGFANHGGMQAYNSGRHPGGSKYGVGLNIEQAVARHLTVFIRAGWNDGRSESSCYAEVDNTASGGLIVHGARWKRPFDRIGAGVASNAITSAHQQFLAAGGSGLMLNGAPARYGREHQVETFYTLRLRPGLYVSPSLQWIIAPGYDRTQKNSLVAGLRTHLEF